jgi:foldase protein PrsA
MGRGFQFYGAVVVGLLIAGGLGFVVYGFGAEELEKWGRPGSTAIQVEDTRYRLDYFASRLTMYVDQSGGQGVVQPSSAMPAVSDLLIQEEIVRRFAGEKDVTATDDEIREEIASRLGITADDESFDVVFQQELIRSELSETDYRQMIEAAVATDKLREKFLAEVPASADSVHYRQIVVSEQATADDIKQQIEAGGDFAALAAENSLDPATKDNGGDVGWAPRGVLGASTEELIFPLEVGEITIIPSPAGVVVIEMLEKDGDHPVEEDQKEPLAARLFADWIEDKKQSVSIVNNMDVRGNFDEGKVQWAIDRAYQS